MKLNVFIKPNEQSGACSDSAMARKRTERDGIYASFRYLGRLIQTISIPL